MPSMIEGLRRQRGARVGSAAVVMAAACFAALLFWTALPPSQRVNESTDFASFYDPVARNVLAGRGLVDGTESPAIDYPPGHPLFLAGTYRVAEWLGLSEPVAVRSAIVLCFGMAAVLLSRI